MKKVIVLFVGVLLTLVVSAQDSTIKKAAIGFRVSYLDFKKTNQILTTLNPKETTVYYAAKDIPMNYAVSGTLFSKFKFQDTKST